MNGPAIESATRAVFFDVDFTLIHPGPAFQGGGYRDFCARHGVDVDPRRSTAPSRRPRPCSIRAATSTTTTRRSSSTTPGGSSRAWEGPGRQVEAAARDIYDEWAACHHFTLYDDVPDVLRRLHASGLKIGLISNSQRCLDSFQTHFALEGLFSVTLSSLEHGYMKPHPSIFEAALRAVDVDAGEAVMVGDSLVHDVEGARRLGMRRDPRRARRRAGRRLPGRRDGDPLFARASRAAVAPPLSMVIRPLTTIDECRKVAELEKSVWGYSDAEDVVPPPILIVSIKHGGILLGAFDDAGEMKGFVYSMAAVKEGRPTQWSHMLGVAPDARDSGLGEALKLAQREQALRMDIDLIEWTFDPLQAVNAHFNFAKLGVVVHEYEENVYGESSSPLHRGTPTDRFVAQWALSTPHVQRRISPAGRTRVRDSSVMAAVVVNPSRTAGEWLEPGQSALDIDAAACPRGDSRELPRHAGAPSHAGARLADDDAADLSDVFRKKLSGRGFPAVARSGAWTVPAGESGVGAGLQVSSQPPAPTPVRMSQTG